MTYPELLARYTKRHGALVEPIQGFDSLSPTLHLAYSLGRVRGFTDLGTYVNKPGDHGIGPPCYAFDLGRADRFHFRGWGYLKARRLAKLYVREHLALNVEYVILGHRIWSRKYAAEHGGQGWHAFTRDDSHLFHLHVSGHHN